MAKRYQFKNEHLKMLVYGQPGSGKTRLSASAALDPRLSPVLMLEAFGNPISISDYEKKPDIITLQEMKDFNAVYKWITEGQNPEATYAQKFDLNPPYETLIVDGLTEIQRFVIRTVQGGRRTKPGDLIGALGRQGFGQLLGTMLNWAIHFVGLDMNVILTSLEKKDQSPTYYKPLLWGQSGGEICGYVYSVVRLVSGLAAPKRLMSHKEDPLTDETDNVAFFKDTVLYYAKDQYYLQTEHMIDPTLTKIVDLMEQSS